MYYELDLGTSTQYTNSLEIDIVSPDVQEALTVATREPIDNQTPIPEALTEAMNAAQSVCPNCILFHATRLQPVGKDRESTCTGIRVWEDGEFLFDLVKSRKAGRASLKVRKTRKTQDSQLLTMPCGVAPAILFPDSSAIQ